MSRAIPPDRQSVRFLASHVQATEARNHITQNRVHLFTVVNAPLWINAWSAITRSTVNFARQPPESYRPEPGNRPNPAVPSAANGLAEPCALSIVPRIWVNPFFLRASSQDSKLAWSNSSHGTSRRARGAPSYWWFANDEHSPHSPYPLQCFAAVNFALLFIQPLARAGNFVGHSPASVA